MIGCYSRSKKCVFFFYGFHCPFLLKGRIFIGTHRTAQDVYSEAWLHAHFPFNPMFLYRSSENSVAPPFFLLADTRQWMTMGVFQSHGRSWSRLKRHRPWMLWMHLGAEVIDLLSRSPTTCGVPTATVNLTRPVFGWPVFGWPVFDLIGLSDFLVMFLNWLCATYKPTTMGIQPNFTGTKWYKKIQI